MADARETEKDPDAFRTISEVAEELALPQHVLRFWESRFHQVKPVKRAGGRRFYRPEDIDLLRGIRRLLYEDGFTIKGAQKILKEQGVRHVQDLGIEGDVAAMRNAAEPEVRSPSPEGKSYGGLLGLLPLRRGKAQENARHEEPPALDEPPLPFDDLAPLDSFAPENEEPVHAPPRTRARAQRVEERRFDGSVYEERIVEERRYESEISHQPEDLSFPEDDIPLHQDEAPFLDEIEAPPPPPPAPPPSFAPSSARDTRMGGRVRAEPVFQPRPSRGPAAHITSPSRPEFQDPLLPFMDDAAASEEEESEPLEERIRRKKAHDQQHETAAHRAEEGPPAEYVPQRHRHAMDAETDRRMLQEEIEEDDLPSVVRGTARDLPQEPHMTDRYVEAGRAPAPRPQAHEEPARAPAPDFPAYREAGRLEPEIEPELFATPPGPRPMRPAMPEPAPQPRRFGPFIEPVVEEFELPPVDMRRAPSGRAAWEERTAWEDDYPQRPAHQDAYRTPPPAPERAPAPAAAPRMRYGVDPHGNEASPPYAPAPQPPPYDGRRMMVQGVMPVLSREDIHRLQAALYELSECQRLMENILNDKKD